MLGKHIPWRASKLKFLSKGLASQAVQNFCFNDKLFSLCEKRRGVLFRIDRMTCHFCHYPALFINNILFRGGGINFHICDLQLNENMTEWMMYYKWPWKMQVFKEPSIIFLFAENTVAAIYLFAFMLGKSILRWTKLAFFVFIWFFKTTP